MVVTYLAFKSFFVLLCTFDIGAKIKNENMLNGRS